MMTKSGSLTVEGITIRKSGLLFVDQSAVTASGGYDQKDHEFEGVGAVNQDHVGDVALWGANNDLPYKIAADMDLCGMLNGGIDMKARIALGKGPMPAIITGTSKDGLEELEFIHDPEISDWMEANNDFEFHYASLKDLISSGNSCSQFILSNDREKILAIKRNDVSECRQSKMNPVTRRVEKLYMSSDWRQYTQISGNSSFVAELPMLDKDFPLQDLRSRNTGFNFAMWNQYPLFARKYYALPGWWPAYKWVKIAIGIPEMKEAMFQNQMTLKYQVIIHELFWEKHYPEFTKSPEKQNDIKNAFYDQVEEYLVGGKNAYKSIFTSKWAAPDGEEIKGIEIISLDDKIKDGKLLPDSAAANSEIAFALQMNTAIAGVSMPGTGSNVSNGGGSNIREAYLVQVMIMEAERRITSRMLNMVKNYNKWDPRPGKQLVFRFPNHILTTLDKGKNTEAVA
jgi:hypothetical protein